MFEYHIYLPNLELYAYSRDYQIDATPAVSFFQEPQPMKTDAAMACMDWLAMHVPGFHFVVTAVLSK